MYNILQLREVFHLEFLRWLGKRIKITRYVLKGGANLRFFFGSTRYSEDMDLDIQGVNINVLKETVAKVLASSTFEDNLKPFGIREIIAPDITKAKQTQTTQRFKIHLLTYGDYDLFTKVEFSRRGLKGGFVIQSVSDNVLRAYKLPPLLVAHYDIYWAIMQKINAIASRSMIQARDIFDLYTLIPQCNWPGNQKHNQMDNHKLQSAYENVFEVTAEQFRDTVISYLSPEDHSMYNEPSVWDEIKLKAANFIDKVRAQNA